MAAGDTFAGLLSQDDPASPPPDPQRPQEPGELESSAAAVKAAGKKGAITGPTGHPDPMSADLQRNAELAQYWQGEDAKVSQRHASERAGLQAGASDRRQEEQLKADWGTTDPLTAAKVKASAIFDNPQAQMAADPVGYPARVEKVKALLGVGGTEDIPSGPSRKFSVGIGAHGEPYYTNLSPSELKQEAHDAANIRGDRNVDEPSVTGLKRIIPGRAGSGEPGDEPTSAADILFKGKMEQVRSVTERPQRQLAAGADALKYVQEKLASGLKTDGETVQQEIVDDMRSRKYKTLPPLVFKEASHQVAKYTRPEQDIRLNPTKYPRSQFMPDHRGPVKPGEGDDRGAPATILNPGGALPQEDIETERKQAAGADMAQHLTDTQGNEQPSAFDYAKGDARPPSPTPKSTPSGGTSVGSVGEATSRTLMATRLAKNKKAQQEQEDYEAQKGGAIDPWREVFGMK